MPTLADQHVDTTVLDAAALFALVVGRGSTPVGSGAGLPPRITAAAPVGAWHSAGGTVHLDIKTDGTYAGRVAGRKRRARGTYSVEGGVLALRDESGLRTPVTVGDGVLEMAGFVLAPR
ncbi:Atu4866 domain-containing protein [Actinoplanes solisilvae]|uniref:Atu4866 domain-containing protein n=1 Tax=Actinoplanes solisilvae TaxID=2486853 RepID=UPI000FDC55DE|nr:Atu4866 domain-containing protein [Actinoplanes solisilvae]